MQAFAGDDPCILCDVVPALHTLGFSEDDIVRHVPHDGPLSWMMLGLSRFLTARGAHGRGTGILALPPIVAVSFLRRALTRRVAELKNKVARPMHYKAEKARRRAMAEERRRVSRRSTTSPCPSREALLDAWLHVRESKESLVRFGSMMQDLECYVDNSLRMDGAGHIVGRNAGVKGWLRENLPELACRYSSVMRYKAAAKKLRQIVGLSDPTPVAEVLGKSRAAERPASASGRDCRAADALEGNELCYYGAEKLHDGDGRNDHVAVKARKTPPVEVVRARAVYLEVMDGIPDVAARVMARIDALCDPERTDEAATLRSWRDKYENKITVRRKDMWWKRLTA